MLLRRKLDPELHGSAGFTSVTRVSAMVIMAGFLAVATHLALAAMYNGRILPGVVVAGHSLGGLTVAQARDVIQKDVEQYRLVGSPGTELEFAL